MPLVFHPLTLDRWNDLVDLFGPERGACAGCWCMWPRIRGVEFKAMAKGQRRDAFREVVRQGPPPGLLAYADQHPVGWVAVSPRTAVLRFDIAKASKPLDDDRVDASDAWAISCFYVRTGTRGQQLTTRLAEAAITYARTQGARTLDVCAIEPIRKLMWGEAFVGIASVFPPLGFVEVARRSPRRPLLRLDLSRAHLG